MGTQRSSQLNSNAPQKRTPPKRAPPRKPSFFNLWKPLTQSFQKYKPKPLSSSSTTLLFPYIQKKINESQPKSGISYGSSDQYEHVKFEFCSVYNTPILKDTFERYIQQLYNEIQKTFPNIVATAVTIKHTYMMNGSHKEDIYFIIHCVEKDQQYSLIVQNYNKMNKYLSSTNEKKPLMLFFTIFKDEYSKKYAETDYFLHLKDIYKTEKEAENCYNIDKYYFKRFLRDQMKRE